MQWKTNMKRTATTTSAIVLALMLAACSNSNNNTVTPTPSQSVEQNEETNIPTEGLPEETGTIEPGVLQPDQQDTTNDGSNNSNDQTAPPVSETIKAEGIYIGAADSHSIEIKVGNDYLPLQVDESLSHIIHEYVGKEEVEFEYVEKEIDNNGTKQLWLVSISIK